MKDSSRETKEAISGLKSSLTKFKNDIIEWMFLLWIGQIVLYAFILMLNYAKK